MLDLGTVRPGTTLYIPFQTFDSNDPSASVTLTGLATTDIEVYKNGSVTQRASDAGYALLDTDGIDFDSTTGIHGFSIDLADNTTAGFYSSGAQYWVVVASVTVDAATVNFIAATFRIGYPDALLNTTIATLSSQTSFTLTAGPADDDALNGCPIVVHDVASAVQTCVGYVSDYTGSTKTVTLVADPAVFTMAATDNVAVMLPSNAAALGGVLQSGADIGTTVSAVDTKVSDIQGATFNTSTDSLEAIRNRGDSAWTGGATTSHAGTAQAGSTSTITLESGASTANDTYNGQVVYISAGTGAGQSRAIGDYVGSTLVATVITNWAVAPSSDSVYEIYPDDITEITAAPTAAAVADAVWDESTAGHTSAGTFGEQLKTDVDAILVDTGSTLDAAIAVVDANVDAILVDTGTTLDGKADQVIAAVITNAAGTDIAADIIAVKADTAAILVDTADMQPKLGTPAADISADIAAVKVDTAATLADTAVIGLPVGVDLSADIAALQATADAVEADTQNIQSRIPASLNNGSMPADVQRIKNVALVGDGSGTPFDVA